MLPNDKTYRYLGEKTFISELDDIHAFIMKDYSIGMHLQDFFEINIVVKGRGRHYIEDNSVSADVGDVFIIPPNVRHGYVGGKGFDVFHLLVSDKFIEKNTSALQSVPSFFVLFTAEPLLRAKVGTPLHLRLSKSRFESVDRVLSAMLEHNRTDTTSDHLIRSSLGMIAIVTLCKIYSESHTAKDENELDGDKAFMNSISMIHERYYEKLTISELARAASLSRSAYIKKFKYVCKMPPAEYVMKRRMEIGAHMLKNTSYTIYEIAVKTGFYDAAHFSKAFKSYNGITPLEYRLRK